MRRGGWWQTLLLGAVAALLRLPNLGRPHAVVFDETYYAKDAWSLLKFGYEVDTVKDANDLLLAGHTDIFKDSASYVVHPPFGKWVIAAGEWAFGMNPFGWRIAVALLGVGAVVLLHRTARRLFQHELTAFIAGLLLAVDGMGIVMSRTALLDQTLMFLTLAAFAAAVADRDRTRARLVAGRKLGFRWHLVLAALLLGLALGTKWSAAWFVVAVGLLLVLFTARVRISLGQPNAWLRAIWFDTLPYLPLVLALLTVVYLATWGGWFLSDAAYNRDWAASHPADTWLPAALRSLLEYHRSAWEFHVNLTSAHSYSANPWTWPLQLRPTSFYYEGFQSGRGGCAEANCAAEVIALGNPLVWWAGTLALLHQAWRAIVWRETRAVAIVVMFLAGWAPWLLYQQRTIFSFYSIVLLPFLTLALAASLGQILGPATRVSDRHRRAALVFGFLFLVLLVSAFFYPLWTGETISYTYWKFHMWLPSWI